MDVSGGDERVVLESTRLAFIGVGGWTGGLTSVRGGSNRPLSPLLGAGIGIGAIRLMVRDQMNYVHVRREYDLDFHGQAVHDRCK